MTASTAEHDALKRAVLDTIVPQNTNSSITELLEEPEDDDYPTRPSLLHVSQRNLLFFDEKLTVHVVLQLPTLPEDALKALLAKLDIKVDAWAIHSLDSQGIPEASSNARDLVYSVLVEKTDDPVILVKDENKDEEGGVSVLVLWETAVILNRPRMRFQNPAISIVASATLKPESSNGNAESESYLPSFQPLEHNIFETFKNVDGFEDFPPYLAESRLERVLPHVPAETKSLYVQGIIPRPIPIVPAISARTRFTRMPTPAGSFDTIASLDFEVTPFVRLDVILEQAKVSMPSGKVENLLSVNLPLSCSSKDCTTFMYKLYPSQKPIAPSVAVIPQVNHTGAVDISISAKISVSSTCTSTIAINWSTSIDFSQALNPSFGPPSQPINRQKRPNSLPFAQQPSTTNTPTFSTNTNRSGLTLMVTAPSTPVIVNIPFTWTIFVRNTLPTPVKLALIPLPRIPRATSTRESYTRRHAPKSSTASFHPSEQRHTSSSSKDREADMAQAICDENIVYALQHTGGVEPKTDVLSLTAELRIGPLAAGCVHEAQVRMVALRTGCLRVEALRVVDLSREVESGVVTDVRDLPDVVCVAAGKGELEGKD